MTMEMRSLLAGTEDAHDGNSSPELSFTLMTLAYEAMTWRVSASGNLSCTAQSRNMRSVIRLWLRGAEGCGEEENCWGSRGVDC